MISELRNYLAGQVVGITRDEALLDEILKCAFCKITLERRGISTAGSSPAEVAAQYETIFAEIRSELFVLDLGTDIRLGPDHIAEIDETLGRVDITDPARDIVGDLYEAFAGAGIRGQEGQFFTPKNAVQALVAMVGPQAADRVLDPACGAGGFLLEAARFALRAEGALPSLGGIDKDAYLSRLARIHVALQFNEQPDVACADSLGEIGSLDQKASVKPGSQTVILTNPPFGSKIVAVTGKARETFRLAHKWSKQPDGSYQQTSDLAVNRPPQILFVERCLDLLAENGRLGIVLPESTLSNSGHRYMVQYLLSRATPIAVVGMPEALFKTSGKGGTHTKVCLVVMEKRPSRPDDKIFMAEAAWCGHDSRGLPIDRDDLPAIVENFSRFQAGTLQEESPLGFTTLVGELRSFVLTPRFYDPEPHRQLAKLRKSHDVYRVGDLVDAGQLEIRTGHEVGKLAYGGGTIPFVRTSDISSWEIKVDPKHGISDELYEQLAPKQDVRAGDILMVRDGTYLIGTCAMVTEHDERMVYQSHLFKLRVAPSAPIDEYLLLAALSSPPVRRQIKANSFTMDIIDSLGDRVRELLLPIPKDAERRREISDMVKRVIADRVEARELARAAALGIAAESV